MLYPVSCMLYPVSCFPVCCIPVCCIPVCCCICSPVCRQPHSPFLFCGRRLLFVFVSSPLAVRTLAVPELLCPVKCRLVVPFTQVASLLFAFSGVPNHLPPLNTPPGSLFTPAATELTALLAIPVFSLFEFVGFYTFNARWLPTCLALLTEIPPKQNLPTPKFPVRRRLKKTLGLPAPTTIGTLTRILVSNTSLKLTCRCSSNMEGVFHPYTVATALLTSQGIHEEMIKDEVRTNSYRQAIINNKHLFRGKVCFGESHSTFSPLCYVLEPFSEVSCCC